MTSMYYVGNYVLSASTFCPLWGSRVSGLHGPVPLTPPAAQKIPAEQKSQDRHVYRHILPAMTKDAQGINTPLKSRRQSGSKWHSPESRTASSRPLFHTLFYLMGLTANVMTFIIEIFH